MFFAFAFIVYLLVPLAIVSFIVLLVARRVVRDVKNEVLLLRSRVAGLEARVPSPPESPGIEDAAPPPARAPVPAQRAGGNPVGREAGSRRRGAGQAMGDALEQYFATHPPSARRAREVERMLRRNARVWQGREWYVGRTNYRDRVPRSREARKLEWARAEER